MKGSLNIFKKATKHFKRIEKKASLKLWHVQIDILTHYAYIFLVVNVHSSLLVEKQIPQEEPGKKKRDKHKVLNFSVCAKKCGLRPEKILIIRILDTYRLFWRIHNLKNEGEDCKGKWSVAKSKNMFRTILDVVFDTSCMHLNLVIFVTIWFPKGRRFLNPVVVTPEKKLY